MDPDGSTILGQLALLAVLICLNAFFSMSELAIISLNDTKIRRMAQEGHKKAGILVRLIDQPSKFLATIQVGITLSSLLAAAIAADTFAARVYLRLNGLPVSGGVVRVLSLILITFVLGFFSMVLGELLPKRIAMQHCERVAFAVTRPLAVLWWIERPFVFLLSSATNGLLRLLGINPDQRQEEVTEEEIRMMIDVGNESGHIEESNKDMINNIFEFDDRTAEEMMSHRTEIVAVEQDAKLVDIIDAAVQSGYSRIPVYEGDLDKIIGILYIKDLLELVLKNPDAPFELGDYLREPLYVLESTNCKTLLTEFQQKKIQMAVVVDEYGGTSGLITMEDLLESIVGNIQDEYDDEEEEIAQISENRFLVDGLADLEEVAEFFGFPLTEEEADEFETIGGYIVHCLGQIPGEAEHPSVQLGAVSFTVRHMDERRIDKLDAVRVVVEPAPQAEAN